jgi:hypothetical protein
MKTVRTFIALCIIAALTGCASSAREVSGSEVLANLTSDPLDCMVYRGSDSTYYYFDRAQFKTTKRFKVRHEEVELPPNAKVGDIPHGLKLRDTAATRPAG